MSRAPKRPDGWEGPEDGAPKALRLVEAPAVEPSGRHLFPFPLALAISAVVVSALTYAGSWIWTHAIVLTPEESNPIVVVRSVLAEEPEEEQTEAVPRQLEALPPKPVVRVPVVFAVQAPSLVPEPEVDLVETPFEVPDKWVEADQPFPKRAKPDVVKKPQPKVAKNSPPKPKVRKSTPVKRSPQVYRQVPPVYPSAARRAGVEGNVLLQVAVQSNGKAGNVSLVSSSGSGLLDAAAIRAVRKWSFRPATLDGRPIGGQVRVPVRFQLR